MFFWVHLMLRLPEAPFIARLLSFGLLLVGFPCPVGRFYFPPKLLCPPLRFHWNVTSRWSFMLCLSVRFSA